MITSEELIEVGKFQKTHALKGELNMIIDLDPEYFIEGNPLIVDYDGIMVPYYAESVRKKGSTSFLIKLVGIDNEEEASQFINKDIYILKKDASNWIEEEFLTSNSFIGYQIIDVSSNTLVGEIKNIDDSTYNVLFIVKNDRNEEFFIPANEDLIKEIDYDSMQIRMNIPEGLLDINSLE